MSDAKLWVNCADDIATVEGTNVSYTMPLWVFNVMREIIMAEAEKKAEVTYRDFDTQQELLDRYRDENAKLREEIEAAKHDLSLFSGELVASKLENAKLRELLSSYWKRTHLHITSNVERDYLSELRELRVEVK